MLAKCASCKTAAAVSAIVGLVCSGLVYADCAARCVHTDAFGKRATPTAPVTSYDLVRPQNPVLSDCYRIWITDDDEAPSLVDMTQQEEWKYRESDGAVTCDPNSDIRGVGVVGENPTGPEFTIICWSECDEQIE